MSADAEARAILAKPGALLFPSNTRYRHDFDRAGGRVETRPSGHRVFYGLQGRRLLYADPDGQVLHECEWVSGSDGSAQLLRARVWLDWNAWVGIVPGGLVNATTFDLSTRPGWQRIRADDLRQMAARAIGVPLSEVQFFYTDDDLRIDARGMATIRHRKDALYVLPDGDFESARFMACMGAMHWADIDFLPVVELFQSLMPGTGSAVLELIRELYDDQHPAGDRPLRYRGLPTYPSEAAFGLFSGFFTPRSVSGTSPFALFMDPPRAHEVTWHPAPAPLRRMSDAATGLCITVQGARVTKATLRDDTSGLSYAPVDKTGAGANGRHLEVVEGVLRLSDGAHARTIPLKPLWGSLEAVGPKAVVRPPSDWRSLFVDGPPAVEPVDAFGAVVLYPEDEREIPALASHPFVADYLADLAEHHAAHAAMVARARSLLVQNFDAGVAALIPTDRARAVRIVYTHPAMAQRQAQRVWTHAARQGQWDWLAGIQMSAASGDLLAAYRQAYDLIYDWMDEPTARAVGGWSARADQVSQALNPGGLACLVGPAAMSSLWQRPALRLLDAVAVETMATFRMHRSILPKARLREGLTLFLVAKS